MKKILLPLFVLLCALFTLPCTAKEAGGVNWEWYESKEYKIKFYIPEGMKLKEKESGDWGVLYGSYEGVKFVIQGQKEKFSLDKIEDYAEKELGISSDNFKKLDSGTEDNLEYRVYIAEGKVGGVKSVGAVFVARHETEDISYLAYMLSTEDVYEEYKSAFQFWYDNVEGLGGKSKEKEVSSSDTDSSGIKWEEYVSKEYSIKFYVPNGMSLKEKERGNWAMLVGEDDVTKVVLQGIKEKKSLDSIEDYAEKELGISGDNFKTVDSGTAHNLEFRTYVAEGKVDGERLVGIVVVARHEEEDISYLAYLLTTEKNYDKYEDSFKEWYKNVYGLD